VPSPYRAVPVDAGDVVFRPAERADVPAVVALLADDELGVSRERVADPLPAPYWQAFDAIDADERNLLVVGDLDGRVVAVLQVTFIPSLTFEGGERAQLEGVRVDASLRGTGVGRRLVSWAVDAARARGCRLVQLTTNRQRADARPFYESLGFVATHDGMKLDLG
jgi:GNAT superfamily N-acetyltransferase